MPTSATADNDLDNRDQLYDDLPATLSSRIDHGRWISRTAARNQSSGYVDWWNVKLPTSHARDDQGNESANHSPQSSKRIPQRQIPRAQCQTKMDTRVWLYASGAMYAGSMQMGRRHGVGVLCSEQGLIHVGTWKMDILTGLGLRTWHPKSPNWRYNDDSTSVLPMLPSPNCLGSRMNIPYIYYGYFDERGCMCDEQAHVQIKSLQARIGPWRDNQPVGDWWNEHWKAKYDPRLDFPPQRNEVEMDQSVIFQQQYTIHKESFLNDTSGHARNVACQIVRHWRSLGGSFVRYAGDKRFTLLNFNDSNLRARIIQWLTTPMSDLGDIIAMPPNHPSKARTDHSLESTQDIADITTDNQPKNKSPLIDHPSKVSQNAKNMQILFQLQLDVENIDIDSKGSFQDVFANVRRKFMTLSNPSPTALDLLTNSMMQKWKDNGGIFLYSVKGELTRVMKDVSVQKLIISWLKGKFREEFQGVISPPRSQKQKEQQVSIRKKNLLNKKAKTIFRKVAMTVLKERYPPIPPGDLPTTCTGNSSVVQPLKNDAERAASEPRLIQSGVGLYPAPTAVTLYVQDRDREAEMNTSLLNNEGEDANQKSMNESTVQPSPTVLTSLDTITDLNNELTIRIPSEEKNSDASDRIHIAKVKTERTNKELFNNSIPELRLDSKLPCPGGNVACPADVVALGKISSPAYTDDYRTQKEGCNYGDCNLYCDAQSPSMSDKLVQYNAGTSNDQRTDSDDQHHQKPISLYPYHSITAELPAKTTDDNFPTQGSEPRLPLSVIGASRSIIGAKRKIADLLNSSGPPFNSFSNSQGLEPMLHARPDPVSSHGESLNRQILQSTMNASPDHTLSHFESTANVTACQDRKNMKKKRVSSVQATVREANIGGQTTVKSEDTIASIPSDTTTVLSSQKSGDNVAEKTKARNSAPRKKPIHDAEVSSRLSNDEEKSILCEPASSTEWNKTNDELGTLGISENSSCRSINLNAQRPMDFNTTNMATNAPVSTNCTPDNCDTPWRPTDSKISPLRAAVRSNRQSKSPVIKMEEAEMTNSKQFPRVDRRHPVSLRPNHQEDISFDADLRAAQIRKISRWLADEVIGYDPDMVEMTMYARQLRDLGFHAIEMIKDLCTRERVESFQWMSEIHKLQFLKNAGLKRSYTT